MDGLPVSDWDLPEANFDGNESFIYNKHNESIFDDYRYFPSLKHDQESVVKFDANNDDFINHATLKALVVQLTSPEVIDYNLICDFFLTYRTFSDSHTVMLLLLTRLVWSLQYVNSFKSDTERIGKLVLVRTFVVLRHWIQNYFVDDFEPDAKLSDAFVAAVNAITQESSLVRANMVFELKILTDLKIHWLSQVNEFHNAGIALDSPQAVYSTPLPSSADYANSKKLSKSNTEASIHTNPSFRRSAMLSLYDQKTHHKCLIFEDSNVNDENPQLSVNNLLAQHKSSRISLNVKLQEFHTKNSKRLEVRKPASKLKAASTKHNYMSLTDSSLVLKKISPRATAGTLEKDGVVPVGFSTNGHVKLPSSKITQIIPCTPVKKMEYTLRDDGSSSPKRKSSDCSDDDDIARKKSIKKIVEGWKMSFNINEPKESQDQTFRLPSSPVSAVSPDVSMRQIGNRVDILSARIIDELEYLIRFYITKNTINESEDKDVINKATIEYSNPVGADVSKVYEENIILNSTPDRISHSDESNKLYEKDLTTQDLSELNIEKIDNLFSQDDIVVSDNIDDHLHTPSNISVDHLCEQSPSNSESNRSKKSSFGGRVTSLNWNDEGALNFENSALIEEDMNKSILKKVEFDNDRLIKTSTQYFDVSSEAPEVAAFYELKGEISNSSDLNSSYLENYDEEVADLGIAMSPQSMKRQLTLQRISLSEHLGTSTVNKRLSMLSRNSSGSLLKRDSAKSYLSYDSAFSVSSTPKPDSQHGANLKKKFGYQNLRKMAHLGYDENGGAIKSSSSSVGLPFTLRATSIHSHMSRTSLNRKSLRFSTLCALTELPFSDHRESGGSFAKMSNVTTDYSRKLSNLNNSSVFSLNNQDRHNSSKDNVKNSSDRSSMNSVAIPGISTYALKELAAIPDESFSTKNPIQFALYKLEGKDKLDSSSADTSMTKDTSEDGIRHTVGAEKENKDPTSASQEWSKKTITEEEHVDTEDILDEINNAVTEDAIGYSSDIEDELRRRPVTPIQTTLKPAINASTSTPTMNALLMSVPSSENMSPLSLLNPKVVLDGYSLTSEHLSVVNVMSSALHISFVLSYDSKTIAEHFTLIEKDMLQEIDWKELIELQWNKELTPVNSWLEIIVNENYYSKNKGVNLVIARFNLMVNWIISEILLTKGEEERISLISRYIHIAYHSMNMQNFATLMQVILALTSEKVTKLKSTWKNLPPGDILTLKNLEELASPLKNFINIRLCTNNFQPSKGCVPFVGLYLSDLIFNAERPKFVKKSANVAPPPAANDSFERSLSIGDSTVSGELAEENDKLINFSRFRTSVHIVKSLSQCIEWSTNYDIPVHDELLLKCLYIKSLDEEEMNYCLAGEA